jgi:hypothetical protein
VIVASAKREDIPQDGLLAFYRRATMPEMTGEGRNG